MVLKSASGVLLVLVALAVAIQFVPYGHDRSMEHSALLVGQVATFGEEEHSGASPGRAGTRDHGAEARDH